MINFLKNQIKDYKIKQIDKQINTLISNGNDDDAIKLIDSVLLKYPYNLVFIYAKAGILIALERKNELEKLFNYIKTIPVDEIIKSNHPKLKIDDFVMKSENDIHDSNNTIDPLIRDNEIYNRDIIKTPNDFIKNIVRRKYYMLLKYNGRITPETFGNQIDVLVPAKHIKYLVELNLKYCPEDKDWILMWFYKEGVYAVERHDYKYALELLNEYINSTKNNEDKQATYKYYSRGLTFFNLKQYEKAISDFKESIKLTKNKGLIEETEELLFEAKRRLK